MSFIEASILVTLSGTQVWRLRYYAGIVKLLLSPAKGGGLPDGNYQIIKNAILNKQQVVATYNGYVREMCPHALGHKNGVEQALFYQFGGYTSKGQITSDSKNNWRCLTISELKNISVRAGEWHTF